MEALACGVPIFATKVGGIEDYLREGINGFAIIRDSADIAEKLRPVLEDPELLSSLREGATSTASEFSWPKIAARYERLLRDLWREKVSLKK
jgi:UDP-glucose:(heptosyl)LPS alpha-1,3-glucosyltransferase